MKKILTLVIALCLFMPASVGLAESSDYLPIQLDLDEDGTPEFQIFVSREQPFSDLSIDKEEYQHITYTHYVFREAGRNDAAFRLTIGMTPQRDVLFFAQQEEAVAPVTTTVTIHVGEADLTHRYVQAHDQETFLGEWFTWHSEEQFARLPLRPVYAQGKAVYVRIAPVHVYQPQSYTVVKQLNQLAPLRINGADDTRYQFQLPGNQQTISETWGILTHRPLVNWEIPFAVNSARKIDIDTFRKLRLDGLYDVTPLTYAPSSKESYYRNPANISGLYHVEDASQPQYGSLIQVMLSHLAYRGVNNQNEQGYWPTSPQSNWLYTDYNIDAEYFDNRRNADNATFLLRWNRQYPDPLVEQTLEKWEAFLFTYIDQTRLVTANQGYLIPDYVDKTFTYISHTALNHQLAVLNYLLESNLYKPDERKLFYIYALLKGIEDTQDRWIKPNADLYYALYRDLRPHPYPDYYSLTLEDLMLTQSLLRQNNLLASPALDKLIQSKKAWMEAQRLQAAP